MKKEANITKEISSPTWRIRKWSDFAQTQPKFLSHSQSHDLSYLFFNIWLLYKENNHVKITILVLKLCVAQQWLVLLYLPYIITNLSTKFSSISGYTIKTDATQNKITYAFRCFIIVLSCKILLCLLINLCALINIKTN